LRGDPPRPPRGGALRGPRGGLHRPDLGPPGILSRAAGGTVLLDEIANATLEAQAKLLRVLSEKVLRPLGGEAEEAVDVRFLFSTSRDLPAEVRAGTFREDLLHLIQVVPLPMPPLRERVEDLPGLAKVLLEEIGVEGAAEASPRPAIESAALRRLRSFPWPGNVRQLRNVLQRALLESPGRITARALESVLGEARTGSLFPPNLLIEKPLPALRRQLERDYLLCHFRRLGGDTPALCRFLGLSSRQLYRRCVRLKVHLRRERANL